MAWEPERSLGESWGSAHLNDDGYPSGEDDDHSGETGTVVSKTVEDCLKIQLLCKECGSFIPSSEATSHMDACAKLSQCLSPSTGPPTPTRITSSSSSSSDQAATSSEPFPGTPPQLRSAAIATGSPPQRRTQLSPQLADLALGKVIGDGAYSTVRLAEDAEKRQFAVKILDKGKVVRRKEIECVFREKMILVKLDHPAIVKLFATAQDSEYLYFVLELCPLGELFHQIKRVGRFDEECARFYAAEINSGLEYIHSKGIVHRDIKPENILLDADWHAKVTDFGTAKEMDTCGSAASELRLVESSFVGTSHYLSPELLNDDKISTSSDMWALGCVVYQMLVGRPPFTGTTDYSIFVQIRENKVAFPDFVSADARDLIKQLLQPDSLLRLNAQQTKAHPWFRCFDWDSLHSRTPPQIVAPISISASSAPGVLSTSDSEGQPLELKGFIASHENVTSVFRPYTNYTIHLSVPAKGLHWTIVQRYSDLLQCHQHLVKTLPDVAIPRFPGKKFLNQMDAAFIQQRKIALSNYLHVIFGCPQVLRDPFVHRRFSIPSDLFH